MQMNQVLGWLCIVVGFVDVAVARLILTPRLPDPRTRGLVVAAVTFGGFMMIVMGGVFLFGIIPI